MQLFIICVFQLANENIAKTFTYISNRLHYI
uniref:Uncharacterized protein n=1 Tax=Anguilla anguilla TaxID=7936 RepID=A0A0E9XWK5_ANGAN